MENILLIGAPNSGKTTLFNWLTGHNQKTVNYPGSTVDYVAGPLLPQYGASYAVYDAPGTYSLFAQTPEEVITCELLFDNQFKFSKIIVVADATQLPRQTNLILQLKRAGFQMVVAHTMHDLFLRDQKNLNTKNLEALLGVPVSLVDGVLGGGVAELVQKVKALKPPSSSPERIASWSEEDRARAEKLATEIARAELKDEMSVQRQTRDFDRYLLHPVMGLIVFGLAMTLLFTSIFWLAAPFMDFVDQGFGVLIDASRTFLTERLGDGLIVDLVSNGFIASVGAVLVFVPQIFILFLGISALEDSGYLARAAALMDGLLRRVGLEGKSFVPLLSGFACAVPAMMAARNVSSARARWITIFILPFMTCSARLPVYALLISFLFMGQPAWLAGAFMAGLYFFALLAGGVAASILSRLVKETDPGLLMLELPYYRRPKVNEVIKNSLRRTKSYVVRSGPAIFTFALIIWSLTTFPNYKAESESEKLATSYAGEIGQVIDPLFAPMGADWRIGVGLMSAFAAREIFVSSLAIVFNVADTGDDEGVRAGLLESMRQATWPDGRPLFTTASVLALCVFFVLALQCLATTGVAIREMRSVKFGLVQLVVMNLVAYISAILTYQIFGP